MIVLVLGAIGVASALWSFERVKRLAALSLRGMWLVWVALGVQVVILQVLGGLVPVAVGQAIHLVTYALLVSFMVLNHRVPGALVVAAGTASNFVAIAVNGGTMPADMGAWARAGLDPIPAGEFANSAALSHPKLLFLGDVFAVPAGWPLANVFSIGDVLIVAGGTYLAHRWCARPRPASTGADEPADTAQTAQTCERVLGADGETRTLTDEDLNLAPLPIGLRRPDDDPSHPMPPIAAPSGVVPVPWPAPGNGPASSTTRLAPDVAIDIAIPAAVAHAGGTLVVRVASAAAHGGPPVTAEVSVTIGDGPGVPTRQADAGKVALPRPAAAHGGPPVSGSLGSPIPAFRSPLPGTAVPSGTTGMTNAVLTPPHVADGRLARGGPV